MRVGVGYDLHRLGAKRPLRLGGIEIPDAPGLIGHSDADVVLHAITDALLGATARGDIGQHFPDTDPAYEGVDSAELLARVVTMTGRPSNVDCTVLAERPRLAPFRDAMRQRIADVLGIDVTAVGVKFTTMEGLGPIGAGRAIACHAVCLIES